MHATGRFVIPASFFSMPLGIVAIGLAWRAAAQLWPVPVALGETLIALGSALWAVFSIAYLVKWLWRRPQASAELDHPVQCCFIGLAGVVGSLVAIGAAPYTPKLAFLLFLFGAAWTIAFTVYRTGRLWMGGRDPETTTPVLYLPTVAGGFVTASAAVAVGQLEWAQLAFGAGFFSWLAIESVLLHRLYTATPLAPALRPTLGIQLAPPAVGAVAYLNVGSGMPDLFVHALVGYALLQVLILLRLLPWVRAAGSTPAWWGFSFGAAALPTAAIKLASHGDTGAVALLAPWLFAAGNLVILAAAVTTVRLIICGKLLPAPVATTSSGA